MVKSKTVKFMTVTGWIQRLSSNNIETNAHSPEYPKTVLQQLCKVQLCSLKYGNINYLITVCNFWRPHWARSNIMSVSYSLDIAQNWLVKTCEFAIATFLQSYSLQNMCIYIWILQILEMWTDLKYNYELTVFIILRCFTVRLFIY